MTLTFGSLFAGIGGMDLGLERAGMQCVWQVEIDDYANRVLAKHWPNVRRWRDVRTFPPHDEFGDYSEWRCDLICGGFPCQDISYAGKGAGLAGERSGLFYEAIRVVRLLRPRYVLLENVAAMLTRGLGQVLGAMASVGYDAEWHCIPAAHFGAPHERDRTFIVGYANGGDCPRVHGTAQQGQAGPANRSDWWAAEPAVGRVAYGIPKRVDRLKCLGNAVVPQVAEWIGRRIVEHSNA